METETQQGSLFVSFVKFAALWLAGIFAAIGFCFVVVVMLYSYFETPSSSFDTYEELAASDLIEKGWVSEYLPRSASDIDESHDIDSNYAWVSFKYSPGDTSLAQKHCKLLHESRDEEKYVCPPYEGHTTILRLQADGIGRQVSEPDR